MAKYNVTGDVCGTFKHFIDETIEAESEREAQEIVYDNFCESVSFCGFEIEDTDIYTKEVKEDK